VDAGSGDAVAGVLSSPRRHTDGSGQEVDVDNETLFARITAMLANVLGIGSNDDASDTDDESDSTTSDEGGTTVNVYVGGSVDEGEEAGQDNHNGQEEDGNMERAELIDLLVNSECCEASREELEETPDNILRLLAARVQSPDDQSDDTDTDSDVTANDGVTDDEGTSEGEETDTADAAPALQADVVAALNDLGPDGIARLMTNLADAEATEAQQREEVIERLVGNKRCQLTQEQLEGVPTLDALRALERSFATTNFTGIGGSRSYAANESKDEWHSDGLRIVPGPAPKE
jgi:hypothetical protein